MPEQSHGPRRTELPCRQHGSAPIAVGVYVGRVSKGRGARMGADRLKAYVRMPGSPLGTTRQHHEEC